MGTIESNKYDVLVSVVIPTFNRPLLARRAVVSALAQTISNIEVIVVDNGSNEKLNTAEIIHSINDTRVRFISYTDNNGPSATRNKGIEAAKGEYIALLDDDDIWFEEKLEMQLKNLNSNKAGITAFISQKGKNQKTKIKNITVYELQRNRDWAICSGLIILADLIKKIKFDNEIRVGEDMDLLFRVLKIEKICYLNEILFIVNAGAHNRITNEGQGDQKTLENRLKFIEKNIGSYGSYWGNVNIAMILFRGLQFDNRKTARFNNIYKRCGLLPTIHVIIKKLIKKSSFFTLKK